MGQLGEWSSKPAWKRAGLVFSIAACFLGENLSYGEGSSTVANDLALQADGEVFAEIADHTSETFGWTGDSQVDIFNPDGSFGARLVSGQSYDPIDNGAHRIRVLSKADNWNFEVRNGAGVEITGRIYALAWPFDQGENIDDALSLSLFARISDGNGNTPVVEVALDGYNGVLASVMANELGVDGASAGKSVIGGTASPQYPLFLSPPELASYSSVTPSVSGFSFTPDGASNSCGFMAEGGAGGTFAFQSNAAGTYRIVCDLDKDGFYEIVGNDDVKLEGAASPGANTVAWDGTDTGHAGGAVPADTYSCKVEVLSGSLHFLANDVEVCFKGVRLFDVAANRITRSGLQMFWDDLLVQGLGATMDNDEQSPSTSGPNGISSGSYGTNAFPHSTTSNGNSRGWGRYSAFILGLGGNDVVYADKGDGTILDTYTWLRSSGALTLPLTVTPMPSPDCDGDGVSDFDEACAEGTLVCDADSDDDGVCDGANSIPGTCIAGPDSNPLDPSLCGDSDGDKCDDCTNGSVDTDNDGTDTDMDGSCNLGDDDDDGDGICDEAVDIVGVCMAGPDPSPLDGNLCGDSDFDSCDDCSSGSFDPANDGADNDGDTLCDFGEELAGSDPGDKDTDDDGVLDGDEASWHLDTDRNGLANILDPDSDNDGIFDGTEAGLVEADLSADTDVSAGNFVPDADPGTTTNPLLEDTDGGGIHDGGEDSNHDGALDLGERDPNNPADDVGLDDSDDDGLLDAEELAQGTDPNDADSDDDGVIDGEEFNFAIDTDGDGLINALDADSDNDGLVDGLERGVVVANDDTDLTVGAFVPDADPETATNPLVADTDRGGVSDGNEDVNHNGAIDGSETNPTLGNGDDDNSSRDSDGDGLADLVEQVYGSDPNNADTDNDGVVDGAEANWNLDTDQDGLLNVSDPDSDNDGVFDGTELGVDMPGPDTDTGFGAFVADVDPLTTTSMLNTDTDRGGVPDGAEDPNGNGAVDFKELNPLNPGDDVVPPLDFDGDGRTDDEEDIVGSDPHDPDSDDDGVTDGDEPNWNLDLDQDGKLAVLDPDADNDQIMDGTELGVTNDTVGPGTDLTTSVFVADSDPSTRTSAANADTDSGGVPDGQEDLNRNGMIDSMEGDPLDPSDDDALVNNDDVDNDGVMDQNDNCENTPNENQLDNDGDGIGNLCDQDADGDGFDDSYGAAGGTLGGCDAGRTGSGGYLILCIALVLGIFRRRRRVVI